MSMDLDIGPLSWVKGEIDLALERAGLALAAHAADPSGDNLQKARASMHQAHGALAIVGLDGITEFADAIEKLLAALGDNSAPDVDAAIASGPGRIHRLARLSRRPGGRPPQPAAEAFYPLPRHGGRARPAGAGTRPNCSSPTSPSGRRNAKRIRRR
jgi:hypothetical protein